MCLLWQNKHFNYFKLSSNNFNPYSILNYFKEKNCVHFLRVTTFQNTHVTSATTYATMMNIDLKIDETFCKWSMENNVRLFVCSLIDRWTFELKDVFYNVFYLWFLNRKSGLVWRGFDKNIKFKSSWKDTICF